MADEIKQLDLFGEEVRPKAKYVQGQVGKDDYGEFTDKFKPRLTTDDCYTPVEVYEAVLGWLREKVDIEGCNIVRPFWPGGDYEAYDYKEDDVVVDNPPFSILAGILRFYRDRGIRFFLFGPQLTLFSSSSSSFFFFFFFRNLHPLRLSGRVCQRGEGQHRIHLQPLRGRARDVRARPQEEDKGCAGEGQE